MEKKEIENILDLLLDLLPGHVYWKDLSGTFMGCNKAQAQSAGLSSKEEMIGKNDYDMPWKKQADQIRNNDLKVMQDGILFKKEEHSVLADGKEAIFLSQKVPIKNTSGKISGILGVSLDITDLKNIEAELETAKINLEKANQAQVNLLNIINHESRNPMNIVLGMAQLLLNKRASDFETKNECYEHFRNRIEPIFNAGKKMVGVINYIYDFVEQEVYEQTLPLEDINLHDVITVLKREHLLNAEQKNIKLNFILDAKTPEVVVVNYRRFLGVLQALVGNAIKYTKNGEVTCSFKFSNGVLEIAVKDTGIGMRKEHAENICNHFDDTKNRTYINSSLVLSICKKRVEMLGGKFTIDSKLDVGTTVTVKIPVRISSKLPNRPVKEYKHEPKVLVIEDNEISAKMLAELLGELNCEVDVAYTGAEAKEFLQQDKIYDLVLVDLLLPDTLGYELVPDIKEHNENAAIVAATAHFTENDKDKCLEIGMDEVLQKPLFISDLKEILQQYVNAPADI